MPLTLAPPYNALSTLDDSLSERGYAVLLPIDFAELIHSNAYAMEAMEPYWQDLPADPYLRDGGHYRYRRHASMVVEGRKIHLVPHRAHWQPEQYNALHGGIERLFEPIDAKLLALPAWNTMIGGLAEVCSRARSPQPWYVEAHQFRIDTAGGIGRPTPEGAHRDGVDFVAVILIERHAIKGGETRIFEAHSPHGIRFTMTEPWTLLMLDDRRVIHETTPIQPLKPDQGLGWRDTLVLTFRSEGFLDAPAS